jgi:transcriptional regulator with XRE-family HTH domain
MATGTSIFLTQRTKLKKTQGQIADEIGVSISTVANWDQGRTWPGVNLLPKVTRAFGLTADQIADAFDKKPKKK